MHTFTAGASDDFVSRSVAEGCYAKRMTLRHAKAAVVLAFASACGGPLREDGAEPTSSETSSPPPFATEDSSDRGTSSGRPAPPRAPTDPGETAGYIRVSSLPTGVPRAWAKFGTRNPNYVGIASCAVEEIPFYVGGGPQPWSTSVSAGHLTFSGDGRSALLPPQSVLGADFSGMGNRFSSGTSVHVHGAGADVPAFDLDVPTVPPPRVTSPSAGAIDGGAPLTVTWEPDSTIPTVSLYLATSNYEMYCETSGNAGTFTLPAAAIGVFAADTATCTGTECITLFVSSVNETSVNVGRVPILVQYRASTVTPLFVQ
jgi:hypothetical protein